MKMPTPNELVQRIDPGAGISVAYQDSRVILNYADQPVIAYGFGYNGFLCVIKTKKIMKAYTYGCKFPLGNYKYGGFEERVVEDVLAEIQGNKLLTEKEIDWDAINNGKETAINYKRPVLGEFQISEKSRYNNHVWNTKYRIVRLKDTKLRAESYCDWRKKWQRADIEMVLNQHDRADDEERTKKGELSVELIKELKGQLVVGAI